MCIYMFIIICFIFIKVKKGDMGEREMLIAVLSNSSSQGSKKKELDSLLRFKAPSLCWTNRAAQFEVEKRDSVAAAL